jgi:1,2-phenylacetyl-CoA epoxidase catalytic subunit
VEWKDNQEKELEQKIDFTSKRELAKTFDTSEKEIQEKLEDLGFRTLQNFSERNQKSDSLDMGYEISDMERRKLQGLFGEKVAVFVKGKIKRFIENSLPENWTL